MFPSFTVANKLNFTLEELLSRILQKQSFFEMKFIDSTDQPLMFSFWILLVFFCSGKAEFQHNQFRQYTCMITNDKEPSDCTLMFKDDTARTTINDNGCFTEKDITRNQILTYCPLQCPEAESAYVILKRPSNNNRCLTFFTYNVVRRQHDWFLWRSGKCVFEEIQFDIGCTFPFKKNINSNTIKQKPQIQKQ